MSAKQETGVRLPGQEDPLRNEMAAHSLIFALEIPWTEESDGLQSMESQESDVTLRLKNNNGEESAINLAEDLLYEMSCFSIISIFFFLF